MTRKFLKYFVSISLALVLAITGAVALMQRNSVASAETAAPVTLVESSTVVASPFTEAVKKVHGSVVGVNNYANYSSYNNYYSNPFYGFGGFGFDFEDLFGGGHRNYQTTSYTENDPALKPAEQAVLAGRYQDALTILKSVVGRRAAWYYWSAKANMGIGNRIAALNDAKTAVNMAPDEPAFRELLAQLNAGSFGYQQRSAQGGFTSYLCSNPCLTLCLVNSLCNCCCGRGGFYYC